jgi:hypothetical protein
MSVRVESHKDLLVWQQAMDLTLSATESVGKLLRLLLRRLAKV